MNNVLFQQAETQYGAGDYPGALQTYTQCLQGTGVMLAPGEIGLLYHRIGNCLMKLRNYDEAIHAYTQAATDATYDDSGAVNCNMGNCYAALHDYEDAVKRFEIAVSDAKYDAPYKAYSGMGKAYLKLGKTTEAGAAFRSAALDEVNPNPSQALLNLGICFMALSRPADAIASYESALQFHMDATTKNKLYANLGQAYVATGQMQQAVNAFEMALADKTYFLNDAASVDYQRAVGLVAQGTAVMNPAGEQVPSLAEQTTTQNDFSGLDVPADGAPIYHETDQQSAAQSPYYYADTYGVKDKYGSSDERFFNASDEELEQWSKGVAKQDRKRRNVGLKILVIFIIILLLAVAAGVFAYTQGYGYPTQETVVQQLFADKSSAASKLFVSDLSSDRISTMLGPVVQDSSVTVDGMERSMNASYAYVTADTPEGGQVHYKVTMARDQLGWKVANIELYFPSQN